MTTSAALDRQVTDEQERHNLLQKLAAENVTVDTDTSLEGLQELYATFGPGAATRNAKIERQRANEETTDPERELETPAADEEEKQEEPANPKPDPDGKALFDSSDYEREDLAIAKVDGQQIDKIAVKFGGRILLDRSAPADVALYNRLKMGAEVELRCAGKVTAVGAGWTTNRDGDLDAIVGEKAVKVETVWVLAPEDLTA